MSCLYNDPCPQQWIYFSVDFGDNESEMLRIFYIGSEDSAQLTIASTGDMTFLHGDSGSEAADTDTKLDAGGAGVIDISVDVTDYHSLDRHINLTDNWRCALKGSLPDADPHTTTTGHWTELTAEAVPAAGLAVTTDDTDSLYIGAGMTERDVPTKVHNTDHGVEHQVHRVTALSTYASGTSTLKIFECDDDSGVSNEIHSLDAGATTVEVAYPAATVVLSEIPLTLTRGKRLVVRLINSVAMSAVRLKLEGRSIKFQPAVRPEQTWSHNQ